MKTKNLWDTSHRGDYQEAVQLVDNLKGLNL